jgi:hypothetical protein
MSRDAVRMRVRRGSLASEKGEDGRVYVFVVPDQDAVHPESEVEGSSSPLIESKDETIRLLREQLEQAHERDRENRRIIAALTSRIPELEASRESDLSVSDRGPTDAPTEASDEQQTAAEEPQGRSWWRRLWGS